MTCIMCVCGGGGGAGGDIISKVCVHLNEMKFMKSTNRAHVCRHTARDSQSKFINKARLK